MRDSRTSWENTTHDWAAIVDHEHLAQIRDQPTTYAPGGTEHLILEVVAYAADAAEPAGRAGRPVVTLHADGSVSVADDGRGTDTRVDAAGRVIKKPVMATRDLRFFDDPGAETLPDGHARRGMSVVAALSEWLIHTNRRTDGSWTQAYEHGVPTTDLTPSCLVPTRVNSAQPGALVEVGTRPWGASSACTRAARLGAYWALVWLLWASGTLIELPRFGARRSATRSVPTASAGGRRCSPNRLAAREPRLRCSTVRRRRKTTRVCTWTSMYPVPFEQAAEAERLISIGAERVDWDRYPDDPDFIVLADPHGNRFCIVDLSHVHRVNH